MENEMEQVVVSAGEPVAWPSAEKVEEVGHRAYAEGGAPGDVAAAVAALFGSAPVVLPETPPADLIEAMATVIGDEACDPESTPSAWASLAYDEIRAWVAGGGETR